MSSILNSISSEELQVQHVPEVKPVKEDSIIDLLQNSEIEFETYPNLENKIEDKLENIDIEFEESSEIEFEVEDKLENNATEFVENNEIKFETCPELQDKLENINTGFGENNDVEFDDKCSKPKLKVPLYQENYLNEFATEEEKAAARHALGLYNKGDVVAMSLLTAEDSLPTQQDLSNATVKQLRKGDKFFTPATSTNAVYDSEGTILDVRLKNIESLIVQQQKEIVSITQVSNSKTISSLGDVRMFLIGFNNGDNLHNTLDNMNKEMLRFEKTGQIQ